MTAKVSTRWWHRKNHNNPTNWNHSYLNNTNYVDEYPAKLLLPRQSFKPNMKWNKPTAAVADITTFSADYYPKQVSKHTLPPKLPYIAPSQSMQTHSMYQEDFPHRKGAPAMPIKPAYRRPAGAKFDALPTYAHDFKSWGAHYPDRPRPLRNWQPPTQQVENLTTVMRDFAGTQGLPAQSAKPKQVVLKSMDPVEGLTTHKLDFDAKKVSPHPPRAQRGYQAPTVPMATTTTFNEEFVAKGNGVRESMRPQYHPNPNKDPMASSSEQKDRFQAWPVEKPWRREQPQYVQPTGKFDMATTSGQAYAGQKGGPAQPVRPREGKVGGGEFEGSTNYMHDFKVWPVAQNRVKVNRTAAQSNAPFDGTTTFKESFVGPTDVRVRDSCRPKQTLIKNQQPLEGSTEYNDKYLPKSFEHRVRYPTPDWLKRRQCK